MRFYLLATLERRPMRALELKDQTGRVRIGTMLPNPALSRLELEMDEPTFLTHTKAIAQAFRISGATVFVASVRDDAEVEESLPHPRRPNHPHGTKDDEEEVGATGKRAGRKSHGKEAL
jgi:hypothetical protein